MFLLKKFYLPILIFLFIGCTSNSQFDLLILNGTVYDGSGNEPEETAIGIRGDEITEIGDLKNREAKSIIDAQGMVVAPGFIDLHAHLEPIFKLSDCESHIRQGVTTSLGGPDGRGPIPFGVYVDSLKQLGVGMNVGFLVGHNSVRREVMNLDNRKPTAAELGEMKNLIAQAMDEGAYDPGRHGPYRLRRFLLPDRRRPLHCVRRRHLRQHRRWCGLHVPGGHSGECRQLLPDSGRRLEWH